ncbi:MAG: hypothetical protein V1846_03320 [Candidatus Komeilibacteria bacterium]
MKLTKQSKQQLKHRVETHLAKQRVLALKANIARRNRYLKEVDKRVSHLGSHLKNRSVGKIVLSILYWCEGKGSQSSSLTFGNSNPEIIKLFLSVLRKNYDIDEAKFRCTLQGRADQGIRELEKYWSTVTEIPLSQFYKARIDPRSAGKTSRKKNYKGVCRIDYFSADIFHELKAIQKSLIKNMGL